MARQQVTDSRNSNPVTLNRDERDGYRNLNTNLNMNRPTRNRWASNPGPRGVGGNPGGSGQNARVEGGGRGRGNVSGGNVWDNNRPGPHQSSQGTNLSVEGRIDKLEKNGDRLGLEMVTNYELTETALNKINAASVIIDCLPFGMTESNDPAIDVVRDLVVTMGGPESDVSQAYFLNVGVLPLPGVFPKIRAIFISEKAAFDFRSEATAARRRGEVPWEKAYVSNDPTKGTRVRVEILQQLAIAVRATVEGRGAEIVVSKFEPRPMLLFKRGGRVYKRLFYSDALNKFGRLVRPQAYELAKKIAGREYEGRMDVVFGV